MAGRPFLNVALPATATAAVAVVSYLLYKKTCPVEENTTPAVANLVSPSEAHPLSTPDSPAIPNSDPEPMTKPTESLITPDSSPCDSPPLAYDEVADSSLQRNLDYPRVEGNNNIWTDNSGYAANMMTEEIQSNYSPSAGPRGDHTSMIDIWKDLPNDNASIKTMTTTIATPVVEITTTSPTIAADEPKTVLVTPVDEPLGKVLRAADVSATAIAAAVVSKTNVPKVEAAVESVEDVEETENLTSAVENMSLSQNKDSDTESAKPGPLNLQLENIDNLEIYEGVSQILPQVKAEPLDASLEKESPYVMQPPAQNPMMTMTSAFDSATHSPSEEMMESPCVSNYSDIHSEESSDSGKGSDIHVPSVKTAPEAELVFEFEIPQDLCGLLIGQQGATIKFIKNKTQTNIYLKRHHFNSRFKLCTISGTKHQIDAALRMIRNKFPENKYPIVTLNQVNTPLPMVLETNVSLPDTMQLFLPEGIMCDVVLSSLVTAGHFFVQQPMHPTYPALSQLYTKMTKCYTKSGTPVVPLSVQPMSICAAPVMGGWYRAQVTCVFAKSEECGVKYLDYGGYSRVPISSLRQIRADFLTIPFQASECYLANVKPQSEEGWSIEAHQVFEELAQGQFLQAQVVGYSENGTPYVHLYRIQGVLTLFINRELVTRGVALWYDHEV